jgi:hypothetical protein
MLEVGERRPEAPQQTRHGGGHPEFLEPRLQLHRLDAVRDEVWPASDCGEAEVVARDRRQPPEQILHVRLVAGALAAEDVGVDDDQRRHAAASS